MQIDYELKEGDFIDSFAAHRSRNIFSKWLIRLFTSIIRKCAKLASKWPLLTHGTSTEGDEISHGSPS
jgi:hypothetical protein